MAQSRSVAALRTVLRIACDLQRLVSAAGRSHAQPAAENLFLRRQLASYLELWFAKTSHRQTRPGHTRRVVGPIDPVGGREFFHRDCAAVLVTRPSHFAFRLEGFGFAPAPQVPTPHINNAGYVVDHVAAKGHGKGNILAGRRVSQSKVKKPWGFSMLLRSLTVRLNTERPRSEPRPWKQLMIKELWLLR